MASGWSRRWAPLTPSAPEGASAAVASGGPSVNSGAAPLSQAPQSCEKMADDGEARMPKDRKSLGFTRVPANYRRVVPPQPQQPHIGLVHQASPGTSEFHQVKLPTLHSTRMLFFFFFFKKKKLDSRAWECMCFASFVLGVRVD